MSKPVDDTQQNIALNTPSAYDKAADGGSLLHQDPVLTKPVKDHEWSIALSTPIDDVGGLYVGDNPSLAMQSTKKEDEEGSVKRCHEEDASADAVNNHEVRIMSIDSRLLR